MATSEQVKELAARGRPASAIAEELGVSRQRIYAIAKSAGIALPKYHGAWLTRGQRTKPKARVITGGVEQAINHSTAGMIAELLVAADLMARGWQVYLPILKSRGHDLIACRQTTLITIEVRSAYRNALGRLIYGKKPDCRSAHYGLVITGEPVTYDPPLP